MHRFAIALTAVIATIVALATPAISSESFTGLPVAPGVRDNDPANASAICNGSNHVRASTFAWATSTPASSIAQWYERALPGSTATTLHPKEGMTEYIVSTSTSRIQVIDYVGRTMLKLEHAEKPIDMGHAQKSCSEAS